MYSRKPILVYCTSTKLVLEVNYNSLCYLEMSTIIPQEYISRMLEMYLQLIPNCCIELFKFDFNSYFTGINHIN